MRILVVGAGALGGYFGARLLAAGRDVTFLVRQQRAEALASDGLSIKSPFGDLRLRSPPTITAGSSMEPYDIVLLGCKAYDLGEAIEAFVPAVGESTTVIPLLNGLSHIETLNARFGEKNVFGGQCMISAALSPQGEILHLAELHTLTFGEQDGAMSDRREAVLAALSNANFTAEASGNIMQEMWEKWVFIATVAAATSLLRASIGDTVTAGTSDVVMKLLDEAAEIASEQGFEPRSAHLERTRSILTTPGSPLMASMLRDIERGARTEVDHILGDLIRRSRADVPPLMFQTAYAHVRSYEARRTREASAR
ncbi:2-dehydropantoate 2-reductase [Tardiphaga sp. 804_B3_N1_9]|uniref:2-dehydropantoate 2-reductase n=1 Tax=Tardiphaga sp. 804_B3_N1_9 TaxID=3240786 RepID=UPI003F1E76EC